jgi:hypothetical protein
MENPGFGSHGFTGMIQRFRFQRGLVFGLLIVTALLAFEIFNYSTTDYALSDLLGDLKFVGIRWSTILALAFCGIDFAGIARLFTPESGSEEPSEVWYLFGAWMLAATMNAMLTWWGVSLAVLNHQTLGNAVVDRSTLLKVVPIFVAIMVWLIRVLIIGSFSVAGERLFSQGVKERTVSRRGLPTYQHEPSRTAYPPLTRPAPTPLPSTTGSFRSTNRPTRNLEKTNNRPEPTYNRPEPTYHPVGMSSKNSENPSRRIDRKQT